MRRGKAENETEQEAVSKIEVIDDDDERPCYFLQVFSTIYFEAIKNMEVYERDRPRQKLRDAQEYHVVLLLDYTAKMVQCTGTTWQEQHGKRIVNKTNSEFHNPYLQMG